MADFIRPCITMYKDDLYDLDMLVVELKRRGFTKVSRSVLIRIALANLNIEAAEKGMKGVRGWWSSIEYKNGRIVSLHKPKKG